MLKRRLGDEGAEQDRERLAEPADPAGDDHRPRGLAEAGRQRRRHQHPDHRRRGEVAAAQDRGPGSAERAVRYQAAGPEEHRERTSERRGDQHPGEVGADGALDDAVEADPLRREIGQPERRRALRRRGRRGGRRGGRASSGRIGSGLGRGDAGGGHPRQPVGGGEAEAAGPAGQPVGGLGDVDRPLVDALDLSGDPRPGEALGALAGRARPSRAPARGSTWRRWSSSASRCGSPGGISTPSTPSLTTSE